MCGMMGLMIVKLCPTTIGKWGLREWVEMERCGIGWECGLLVEAGFGWGWLDDSWDMMGGEQQPPSIKWMNWKMVFETIDWVFCGRSVDSVRPRLMMIGYEWGGVEFVLRILEGWLMVRMWGVGMKWLVLGMGCVWGEMWRGYDDVFDERWEWKGKGGDCDEG